jgi:IMP dehydrogenase
MVPEIIESGGLAILHRFMEPVKQLRIANEIVSAGGATHFAVSVGVKLSDREMVSSFHKAGVQLVCIDIAHGDSEHCVDMVKWIKDRYPGKFVIAGNVATGMGAQRLWLAGADVVKVGVGPGSLCSTRIETGNGVPQMTALMDVANMRKTLLDPRQRYIQCHEDGTHEEVPPKIERPIYIMADGGIKSAGDIVKSLCFADMTMVGNLFAGCTETPGGRMMIDDVMYKEYAGSSTHKKNHVEGVAALVRCTGDYYEVLTKLLEGLRSGMSYQGAHNLQELQEHPEFVRITNSGLVESHPHNVLIK